MYPIGQPRKSLSHFFWVFCVIILRAHVWVGVCVCGLGQIHNKWFQTPKVLKACTSDTQDQIKTFMFRVLSYAWRCTMQSSCTKYNLAIFFFSQNIVLCRQIFMSSILLNHGHKNWWNTNVKNGQNSKLVDFFWNYTHRATLLITINAKLDYLSLQNT